MMKCASVTLLALTAAFAAALAMPAAGAQAQAMGEAMGGGGHKHQQKADKATEQKPKADEKAYAAALKLIPDKPFDPWHSVR